MTKYTLSIIRQQTGSDTAIDYLYDASGSVIGMKYNGAYYYYVKDAQNNVARIVNAAGVQVTEYQYDAWGNMISATGTMASTIGAVNPFRYRSYYYDTDTGLYYLQSRYYDSVVKRFVNEDAQLNEPILGSNVFAYCENNPVNYADPNGYDAILLINKYGAKDFGHAALLIQCGRYWYYFSVTNKQTNGTMIIDFKNVGYIFYPSSCSVDLLNEIINVNSTKLAKKASYTDMHYITGDFTQTAIYCYNLASNPETYNLITNNCIEQASIALSKGTCTGKYSKEYTKAIKYLCKMTIPNNANDAFYYFEDHVASYYSASKLKKLFMRSPYYGFELCF
ncbi:MAG: RHS repeat-associated core domain-containing protein [Oscillospiraceae bacterium]